MCEAWLPCANAYMSKNRNFVTDFLLTDPHRSRSTTVSPTVAILLPALWCAHSVCAALPLIPPVPSDSPANLSQNPPRVRV